MAGRTALPPIGAKLMPNRSFEAKLIPPSSVLLLSGTALGVKSKSSRSSEEVPADAGAGELRSSRSTECTAAGGGAAPEPAAAGAGSALKKSSNGVACWCCCRGSEVVLQVAAAAAAAAAAAWDGVGTGRVGMEVVGLKSARKGSARDEGASSIELVNSTGYMVQVGSFTAAASAWTAAGRGGARDGATVAAAARGGGRAERPRCQATKNERVRRRSGKWTGDTDGHRVAGGARDGCR